MEQRVVAQFDRRSKQNQSARETNIIVAGIHHGGAVAASRITCSHSPRCSTALRLVWKFPIKLSACQKSQKANPTRRKSFIAGNCEAVGGRPPLPHRLHSQMSKSTSPDFKLYHYRTTLTIDSSSRVWSMLTKCFDRCALTPSAKL